MTQPEPDDYTDLTCTNLMIKLKILTRKLGPGESISFFATREQVDNTCSPFSRNGYLVEWTDHSSNRYLVEMGKL